ncbi:Actin-like protein arp9 [Cryptotrichosporon argae]
MSDAFTQQLVIHVDDNTIRAGQSVVELFPRPAVVVPASYSIKPDTLSEFVAGSIEGAETRWPFRPSSADDWEGREFLLKHVLSLLGVDTSSNPPSVLLVPPCPLPQPDSALYTQLAFEKLNLPAFSLLCAPLAALFALNTTTGIVVHVGHETTTVSVVVDAIARECGAVVELGRRDVEAAFARALAADDAVDAELRLAAGAAEWTPGQKDALVTELVGAVIAECGDDIDIPLAQAGAAVVLPPLPAEEDAFDVAKKLVGDAVPQPQTKSKKVSATARAAAAAADAAAADIVAVTVPSLGKEVNVGRVRHRLLDPLLKGIGAGGDTVWEGVGRAVDHPCLSVPEKISVYDAIAVTGELAHIRSFQTALITYLAPFLLSSADFVSDSQPSRARALTIPDYLANFKGATNDLAPFLGASMVAKASFSDTAGKHCVTKIDYNAKGPAAIYAVTSEA